MLKYYMCFNKFLASHLAIHLSTLLKVFTQFLQEFWLHRGGKMIL